MFCVCVFFFSSEVAVLDLTHLLICWMMFLNARTTYNCMLVLNVPPLQEKDIKRNQVSLEMICCRIPKGGVSKGRG